MSVVTVAVGDVAAVRLAGLDRASPRLRAWVHDCLGPLTTDRAPDATIRFVDRLAAGTWRLQPHPLGPTVGGLWVADHLDRAAELPLSLTGAEIEADGAIEPYFFEQWVLLPLLAHVAWRRRALLVRAAGVAVGERRIAFTAPSETGKSRVVVALLRDGARLLGDDLLVLGPDGTVGAVSAQLVLRDEHRKELGPHWPATRSLLRRGVATGLRWAARRLARRPLLSLGLGRLSHLSWKFGTVTTSLGTLFPGAEMATPGPLDEVVLLAVPGVDPPDAGSAADVLVSQLHLDYGQFDTIRYALRYCHPGRAPAEPFATEEASRKATHGAVAGANVTVLPFDGSDRAVAAVADRIRRGPA